MIYFFFFNPHARLTFWRFLRVAVSAQMEYPPNNTLYVNNLNEKVKKEGKLQLALWSLSCLLVIRCVCGFYRAEEIAVCSVLAVRPHTGHRGSQEPQNARAGFCRV